MICSNCGFNNSDDSVFCEKCGNRLISALCPKCGSELMEGDEQFCPFCGEVINEIKRNDKSYQIKKKSRGLKTAIIIVFIVIAVCLSFFVIWHVLSGEDNIDKQQQSQPATEQTHKEDEIINNTEPSEPETQKTYNDNSIEPYADGYCHLFYFDMNGGTGSLDSMEIYEGEEVSLPSYTPEKSGCSFVGWQVKRLVDDKYYYTSNYSWMDISEGDEKGYSPSLYQPGQILIIDDSWKKGGVSNSNYEFIAVWR